MRREGELEFCCHTAYPTERSCWQPWPHCSFGPGRQVALAGSIGPTPHYPTPKHRFSVQTWARTISSSTARLLRSSALFFTLTLPIFPRPRRIPITSSSRRQSTFLTSRTNICPFNLPLGPVLSSVNPLSVVVYLPWRGGRATGQADRQPPRSQGLARTSTLFPVMVSIEKSLRRIFAATWGMMHWCALARTKYGRSMDALACAIGSYSPQPSALVTRRHRHTRLLHYSLSKFDNGKHFPEDGLASLATTGGPCLTPRRQ